MLLLEKDHVVLLNDNNVRLRFQNKNHKIVRTVKVFQRFSVFLDQNSKADVFEEVNSVDVTEYLRIVADDCFFVFSFFEKIEIDSFLK